MPYQSKLTLEDFRPRFSGHETFPLRYDWLRKFLVNLEEADGRHDEGKNQLEQEMIAFGVGKNMVRSMRYWVQATRTIEVIDGKLRLTRFGELLLECDPFLDSLGTIWALHWMVATNAQDATTWYWLFNVYPSVLVGARTAVEELQKFGNMQGWRSTSENTLRRDVDCFLRCYTVHRDKKGGITEDSIECPLAELELLRPQSDGRTLEFQRGPKPTLPDGVFIFSLNEFWRLSTNASTLSLDDIAHSPGSPGRVFRLDESALLERLERIEVMTNGALRWVDTAGLQQVTRLAELSDPESLIFDPRLKVKA